MNSDGVKQQCCSCNRRGPHWDPLVTSSSTWLFFTEPSMCCQNCDIHWIRGCGTFGPSFIEQLLWVVLGQQHWNRTSGFPFLATCDMHHGGNGHFVGYIEFQQILPWMQQTEPVQLYAASVLHGVISEHKQHTGSSSSYQTARYGHNCGSYTLKVLCPGSLGNCPLTLLNSDSNLRC